MRNIKIKRYSVQWFIDKFRKIPSKEIGRGGLFSHCVYWHCGIRNFSSYGDYKLTIEAEALNNILGRQAWQINDKYTDTPKNNILRALRKKL